MTNKNIAIRVRELDKKFTFGRPQEKYHTLHDAIVNSEKAPFKRFHCAPPSEEFWVLKDVSFDVEQGNGAGKLTLLKILSRITTQSQGDVEIYGRVGSLPELRSGSP